MNHSAYITVGKKFYMRPAIQIEKINVESLVCVSLASGSAENVTTEARGCRNGALRDEDEEIMLSTQEESADYGSIW